MKRLSFLLSIIFLSCLCAAAQTRPDYTGEWKLDKEKSKSAANLNVESINIKSIQTISQIKVDVATTFPTATEETSPDGQTKRVRKPLNDGTSVYSLDGKETTGEVDTPAGKMPIKFKANFETDGKLNLNVTRTIKTPNGDINVTINEIWELADNGKTLQITRETKAQNNSNKVSMTFTKK